MIFEERELTFSDGAEQRIADPDIVLLQQQFHYLKVILNFETKYKC